MKQEISGGPSPTWLNTIGCSHVFLFSPKFTFLWTFLLPELSRSQWSKKSHINQLFMFLHLSYSGFPIFWLTAESSVEQLITKLWLVFPALKI